MIVVTRLNGSGFAVNPDLVERIQETPDTTLIMVDGAKYIVRESMAEVIDLIAAYRARIVTMAYGTEGPRSSTNTGPQPTLAPVAALHAAARSTAARWTGVADVDIATIVGILLAFGALFGMIEMEHVELGGLFLPAPILLVFGATIGCRHREHHAQGRHRELQGAPEGVHRQGHPAGVGHRRRRRASPRSPAPTACSPSSRRPTSTTTRS